MASQGKDGNIGLKRSKIGSFERARDTKRGSEDEQLTRRSLHPLISPCLILSNALAKCLVSGRQRDDGEKGDYETEGRVDVPLAEDDAEVLRIPGEEHVHATPRRSFAHPRMTRVHVTSGAHVAVAGVVHVGAVVVAGVIHGSFCCSLRCL